MVNPLTDLDVEEQILVAIERLGLKRFIRIRTAAMNIVSVLKFINTETFVIILPVRNTFYNILKNELSGKKVLFFNSMKLKQDELIIVY